MGDWGSFLLALNDEGAETESECTPDVVDFTPLLSALVKGFCNNELRNTKRGTFLIDFEEHYSQQKVLVLFADRC